MKIWSFTSPEPDKLNAVWTCPVPLAGFGKTIIFWGPGVDVAVIVNTGVKVAVPVTANVGVKDDVVVAVGVGVSVGVLSGVEV